MLIVKIIENNTMYSAQELNLCIFSVKIISAIYTLSIFSVHSSTNLSTNFSCFYSFHSLNIHQHPLLHTPLSVNSLHSHLHLSLFQRCLLLQTFASNLHLHLHVSCHSMSLVSLVLDIILNTFKFFTTLGTHIFAYGSLILVQLRLHLLALILKG